MEPFPMITGDTPGTTYEAMDYEATLAVGATYQPPKHSFFQWTAEAVGASDVNLERNRAASWFEWITTDTGQLFVQNDEQDLRLINDGALNARWIKVWGIKKV